MATEPTSALPTISPVRDPLKITFQDSGNLASENEEPTELEVQVEVEDVAGSDEWRRVGEMLNPYGADDTASVLIHRALMGALIPLPPDPLASAVVSVSELTKRYRLQARDVIGGEALTGFAVTDPAFAWLAGRSYHSQEADILDGKAYLFLTTRPQTRRWHSEEKIILYLLPLATGTATLRAVIYFTDGTDQTDTTKTFGSVVPNRPKYLVYELPVVEKTIDRIEFDITGLTGTAEKLTYKLISRPTSYFTQLIYLNSLGGYDSFPLMGKNEESHTDTGEIFEGQLYPPLEADKGNYQTFNQRSHESFVLRSGWISLPERLALRDLTLRNEAYLLVANTLRKLIITNAEYPIKKDGEFLHSIEITARFAHDQHAYDRV